jgi:hypothetical protein
MLILDYVVTVYSREWTVTATRYKLDKEISEPPRQRERKSKSKSDERENRKNIKSVKEREGERERELLLLIVITARRYRRSLSNRDLVQVYSIC